MACSSEVSTFCPRPLACPRHQRRQDAIGRERAGQMIGQRNAHRLRRLAVGQHREQAGHRLADRVVAGPAAVRAFRTEAGDRAIDQPRIVGGERLIAEAEPVHRAGAEILDDDVGSERKLSRRRLAVLGLQVERDALLVAVHRAERAVVVGLAPHPERIAAVRRLDLDDLGAQVRQQHAGERPADIAGEFEDLDAVEGAGAHGRSSFAAGHAATGLNFGSVIASVIGS